MVVCSVLFPSKGMEGDKVYCSGEHVLIVTYQAYVSSSLGLSFVAFQNNWHLFSTSVGAFALGPLSFS